MLTASIQEAAEAADSNIPTILKEDFVGRRTLCEILFIDIYRLDQDIVCSEW
jgi:hypothetical protein